MRATFQEHTSNDLRMPQLEPSSSGSVAPQDYDTRDQDFIHNVQLEDTQITLNHSTGRGLLRRKN
jgi:hypothetical protein